MKLSLLTMGGASSGAPWPWVPGAGQQKECMATEKSFAIDEPVDPLDDGRSQRSPAIACLRRRRRWIIDVGPN